MRVSFASFSRFRTSSIVTGGAGGSGTSTDPSPAQVPQTSPCSANFRIAPDPPHVEHGTALNARSG